MALAQLLGELARVGVGIRTDGAQLYVSGVDGPLPPHLEAGVRSAKGRLVAILADSHQRSRWRIPLSLALCPRLRVILGWYENEASAFTTAEVVEVEQRQAALRAGGATDWCAALLAAGDVIERRSAALLPTSVQSVGPLARATHAAA